MPTPLDSHLVSPFLSNSFDFSRYPSFKTRDIQPSKMSDTPRPRARGRTLLASRHPPSSGAETFRRLRNVSESQLTSFGLADVMKEPCSPSDASACTVGNAANVTSGDKCSSSQSYRSISVYDSSGNCQFDDDNHCKTPSTIRDSCGISEHFRASKSNRSELDSLYSMDSADQDAHPLLLSMPIIPLIKLERKATVRKPDLTSLPDAAQNKTFLSPRIPDLRTPARLSSRRYGRILGGSSASSIIHNANDEVDGTTTHHTSRRCRSISNSIHADDYTTTSAPMSESTLTSPYESDDKRKPLLKQGDDESPHSDLLLCMINEVDSLPDSCGDCREPNLGDTPRSKQGLPQLEHSRYLSSTIHSALFGSTTCTAMEECNSADPRHKAKTGLKSTTERKPVPNIHDPTSKWTPKNGQIIVKVFVPSTDDIWMFRVPQDINLVNFTSNVVIKLGFAVSFSGSVWDEPRYHFKTDVRFKSWIKGRIRFGRNLPIVAHVLAPLPLIRLGVDADGCEVWCYA